MNLAGLILVSYGGRGVVELESGERLECKYRRSVGRPCCGDRVTVQHADDESTVVVAIEPRRNEFARADARQRRQVIAANLDLLYLDQMDRHLQSALSGAEALQARLESPVEIAALREPFRTMGYCFDEADVGPLAEALRQTI